MGNMLEMVESYREFIPFRQNPTENTTTYQINSESCFVTSRDGAAAGEKFWTQFFSKLEKIRLGGMQGF